MPLDEKDLYSEAGELLRHYFSWREKLLGGYMAVIAALAVAVKSSQGGDHFGSVIAGLGMLLTLVFWLLERRNRRLFLQCIKAGVKLEKNASLRGPFIALDRLDEKPLTPSHSRVLDSFFGCAVVALAVVAVLLWPKSDAAAHQAHEAYVTAMNSNNVDSLLGMLTDDVVLLSPHEPAIVGKAAVRSWIEGYAKAFKTHWDKPVQDFILSGDWVFERYSYKSTDTPVASGPPVEDSGWGLVIYHHDTDGKWRVSRDAWGPDHPLPVR